MYNTVRRMTDTNLTLFPLSQLTVRAGYSQNIFGGPSLTPSGYQFAGSYATVVQEMQRNSTDNFTFGVDWKPVQGTKFTMEEEIDHLKADSYMTVNPSSLVVQEADGTKAALLANSYAQVAYSASNCNANSIGTTPILSAPNTPGALPVINAACNVMTSYLRSQPTRIILPDGNLPVPEHKHQECLDERRRALHCREYESAELLREFRGSGGDNARASDD